MRGRASFLGVYLAVAVVCLPAGVAGAKAKLKTKTFSSGNINRQIPEPLGIQAFPITSSIQVKPRGRVKDVNVAVRVTIPDDRDLEILVQGPTFKGARLKEHAFRNDLKGADFGAGPACAGVSTVFDSQATISIFQGLPPFLGSFVPRRPSTGSTADSFTANGRWSCWTRFRGISTAPRAIRACSTAGS